MQRQSIVQDEIDDLMISLGLDEDGVVVPEDLQGQVQAALDRDRTISWDKALRRIVQDRDL